MPKTKGAKPANPVYVLVEHDEDAVPIAAFDDESNAYASAEKCQRIASEGVKAIGLDTEVPFYQVLELPLRSVKLNHDAIRLEVAVADGEAVHPAHGVQLPGHRAVLQVVDLVELANPHFDVGSLRLHRFDAVVVTELEPLPDAHCVSVACWVPIASEEPESDYLLLGRARDTRGCSQFTGQSSDLLLFVGCGRRSSPAVTDPEGSGREQSCPEGYTLASHKAPGHNRYLHDLCASRLGHPRNRWYGRRGVTSGSANTGQKNFARPCCLWPESAAPVPLGENQP